MVDLIRESEEKQMKKDMSEFSPGDEVKVHVKVSAGETERIQVFAGTVISRKHGGTRETFTVRKISYGVGVERIFLLHSPIISKLEITKKVGSRRAKLYYMRNKKK